MGKSLLYGLNLTKKPASSQPAPARRKPVFGSEDDSDDDVQPSSNSPQTSKITELVDFPNTHSIQSSSSKPSLKSKSDKLPISMYGDLSSSLESRKHQAAAEELDPSIYDYDAVYDSLKPEKKISAEDAERKSKYMRNVMASAAVRKRDALIAEEKKIAREREAEGDEFAGKEKFVTEAYKKQQEENRRLEEEERQREEEEAKKNKTGGMTAFYKQLLERGDETHSEIMKAAEQRAKGDAKEVEGARENVKTEADIAREINEKGGSVSVNEEGQVVDKRELLKGGLNVGAKKKPDARKTTDRAVDQRDESGQSTGYFGAGGKTAMRERQSRMLEAQLAESQKRNLEYEEEERQKIERAAKSRKTRAEISNAKERYLARKRAAEDEKKKGGAGQQ